LTRVTAFRTGLLQSVERAALAGGNRAPAYLLAPLRASMHSGSIAWRRMPLAPGRYEIFRFSFSARVYLIVQYRAEKAGPNTAETTAEEGWDLRRSLTRGSLDCARPRGGQGSDATQGANPVLGNVTDEPASVQANNNTQAPQLRLLRRRTYKLETTI
jgi:hypothetical protein